MVDEVFVTTDAMSRMGISVLSSPSMMCSEPLGTSPVPCVHPLSAVPGQISQPNSRYQTPLR